MIWVRISEAVKHCKRCLPNSYTEAENVNGRLSHDLDAGGGAMMLMKWALCIMIGWLLLSGWVIFIMYATKEEWHKHGGRILDGTATKQED